MADEAQPPCTDIAVQRFLDDHATGCGVTINTPDDCSWSLFFALQQVFAARGFEIPPLYQMYKIFQGLVREGELPVLPGETDNHEDFTLDQAARILHGLGQLYGLGDLQLGIWQPGRDGTRRPGQAYVFLCPFPGSGSKVADHTIWLRHTGAIEGSHGHYSAMWPAVWPAGGDVIAMSAEERVCAQEAPREQLFERVQRIIAVEFAMRQRRDDWNLGMSIADVTDRTLEELVSHFPWQQILQIIAQASVEELKLDGLGDRAKQQRLLSEQQQRLWNEQQQQVLWFEQQQRLWLAQTATVQPSPGHTFACFFPWACRGSGFGADQGG